MVHGGVPCEPIQGQGQGHETLKVRKSAIFKMYLLPLFQCERANDCRLLNYGGVDRQPRTGLISILSCLSVFRRSALYLSIKRINVCI